MNFDAIAPSLNNVGHVHIYLLHLFIVVDYRYCSREFLAQQPQKVSLDIPLSFYPLSSSSNDNFLAAGFHAIKSSNEVEDGLLFNLLLLILEVDNWRVLISRPPFDIMNTALPFVW